MLPSFWLYLWASFTFEKILHFLQGPVEVSSRSFSVHLLFSRPPKPTPRHPGLGNEAARLGVGYLVSPAMF